MKQYDREEKKELCKRYNQEGNFDNFSKEEKLALALWQVEVL